MVLSGNGLSLPPPPHHSSPHHSSSHHSPQPLPPPLPPTTPPPPLPPLYPYPLKLRGAWLNQKLIVKKTYVLSASEETDANFENSKSLEWLFDSFLD